MANPAAIKIGAAKAPSIAGDEKSELRNAAILESQPYDSSLIADRTRAYAQRSAKTS
jgi:hypothetical protein